MNDIEEILNTYGVNPLLVENITDTMFRIDDGKRLYALKKTHMKNDRIQMFESVYKQANEKQLSFILPLYLTHENKIYTRLNENHYYLTSWISSDKTEVEKAIKIIGKLHQSTSETYQLNARLFDNEWKKFQAYCDKMAETYFIYVEQFEADHYMSPVGLQVCTHFRHLKLVFNTLQDQINQLITESNSQKSSTYCLCHGNLKPSFILGEKDIVILNWEHARFDHAAIDLAFYLRQHMDEENESTKIYSEVFDYYMQENKLTKFELHILIIHLLDPSLYIEYINSAVKKNTKHSMITHVQELQRNYQQILLALELSAYIQETYFLTDLEDLAQDT